jgi:trimethylamine corrinoid protein
MKTDIQIVEYQENLKQAIDQGDENAGVALAQKALAAGMLPVELIQEVIKPVMKEYGDAFARLERFLPDLMYAGMVVKAMQSQVLEPAIRSSESGSSSMGTIVIGTSEGDIHDIGKNMVALMLQVNGFKVIDLGTNVSPHNFISAAQRERADIIAMSSLLTASLPYMKDVIKRLESMGERDRYLVIAGGAAVSNEWAKISGMDGIGEDAVEAVALCQKLIEQKKEGQA